MASEADGSLTKENKGSIFNIELGARGAFPAHNAQSCWSTIGGQAFKPTMSLSCSSNRRTPKARQVCIGARLDSSRPQVLALPYSTNCQSWGAEVIRHRISRTRSSVDPGLVMRTLKRRQKKSPAARPDVASASIES